MNQDVIEHAPSSAEKYNDVPVDNAMIVSSIRNGIKMGWNNETICRVVGMPQEVVDKHRALLKKEQSKK